MYAYIHYEEMCQFTIIRTFIDSVSFSNDSIIILVKIQGCYHAGNTIVAAGHYGNKAGGCYVCT